jgi:hypothetical protein
MISEAAAATLEGALVGGAFALLCMWMGFFLSRLASESDRRKEALFTIYHCIEKLKNLLIAFQKQMIDQGTLYPKWERTTEDVLVVIIRSGLSREEKKRVLRAINGKWEDPNSVTTLQSLADELLKKIDPTYAQAAKELLDEAGIKVQDIDPVIVAKE